METPQQTAERVVHEWHTSKENKDFYIRMVAAGIEADRAQRSAPEPTGFEAWRPDEDGLYWFITATGRLSSDEWNDEEEHAQRWKYGNMFPSKAIAECQAKIEALTRKLNQACVARGGSLLPGELGLAGFAQVNYVVTSSYGTSNRRWTSMYWFENSTEREGFSTEFNTNLIELATLKQQITQLWREHQASIKTT